MCFAMNFNKINNDALKLILKHTYNPWCVLICKKWTKLISDDAILKYSINSAPYNKNINTIIDDALKVVLEYSKNCVCILVCKKWKELISKNSQCLTCNKNVNKIIGKITTHKKYYNYEDVFIDIADTRGFVFWLSVLKDTAHEMIFMFNNDTKCITINAIQSNDILIKTECNNFNKFMCKYSAFFVISIEDLYNKITNSKFDKITLSIKNSEKSWNLVNNKLYVNVSLSYNVWQSVYIFNNECHKTLTTTSKTNITTNIIPPNILKNKYVEFSIPSRTFSSICKQLSSIGKNVSIKYIKNQVIFKTKGRNGECSFMHDIYNNDSNIIASGEFLIENLSSYAKLQGLYDVDFQLQHNKLLCITYNIPSLGKLECRYIQM